MRSITGEGVRQTHAMLSELLPLQRSEVPTGTQVFDWTVPKEWVVRRAYVVNPRGERILDVQGNNLHLVQYSVGFQGKMELDELDEHLHSLPELPDAVPYVTSYWKPYWGFCLSERQRSELEPGEYSVVIDADHVDGSMTLSEAVLPGEAEDTVLISVNTCHPSMANNDLSGPLVAAFLYRKLADLPVRRLTFRFIFLPETIGSIAFLSRHGADLKRTMVAGYTVTCVGDGAPLTYKRSKHGDTLADRAAAYALGRLDSQLRLRDFWPLGSDERQYCSPGFDLPVGSIMRSVPTEYSEYHTSLDNRDFISFEAMERSVDACFELCRLLDRNLVYRNQRPFGEPKLDRLGLFPTLRTERLVQERVQAGLWLVSLSDGQNDLLAVAERSGLDFWLLAEVASVLESHGLLSV